ncbi:hypothetical protein BFJ72_g10145 [Fusarium proliferatum]|uniref:Uncharacterized protein n=1 Tax=Gibberella intermedia TaxID=948311 RepID=A0A420SV24_GIBIN|nr:hypothetical protein BFJ72_g10145 [Fusarium proliferatum]
MTQPMVVEDPDHGVGLKQTKEMPTLSAEEIPLTTFHSFPNLATELRLKIWKAACFPYAATKRGLHYINLESIWGNEISGELITEMAAMEMKALHSDFQTSSNLQGVPGNRLLHSFNLVLEFNAGWLDNFPESWNKLKEEESSRGLFATWAEGCMRGRGNASCIYLLNKAARWGPHWWVKDDIVFHDCGDAYVEVDNEYFGFFPGKPAEASAMLQFLWRVWALRTVAFCEDCTHDEICEICQLDPGFDMTEFVKVLVRHEKEPARGQIEDRADELDELAKGNDCKVEHDSEDDKEVQEASESKN